MEGVTKSFQPPLRASDKNVFAAAHHLAPNRQVGFVFTNGSMFSSQHGEGEIRGAIAENLSTLG